MLPRARRQIVVLGIASLITGAITTLFLQQAVFKSSSSFLDSNTTNVNHGSGRYPFKPLWTSEHYLEPNFAYAMYATDKHYFCNTLINTHLLKRYGAQYDVVLMYPRSWDDQPSQSDESRMLSFASKNYPSLVLQPVEALSTSKGDPTWSRSLTKFNAYRLTNYSRILYFDSDSLVLNSMDHYFLAPNTPLAVPRAYWLNDLTNDVWSQILTSHVMLLQPGGYYWRTIYEESERTGEFDMEVINHLFGKTAMILPHRRLALLTGEFRSDDHSRYLADEPDSEWNAMAEVSRSYLVHFSDWPLPKPWLGRSQQIWESTRPSCNPAEEKDKEKEDRPECADRMMWEGFYAHYNTLKADVCGGMS